MTEPLELRILTGHHAGVTARVRDGDRLGSAADCDLILADAGVPADGVALTLATDTWALGDLDPLAHNQPLRFGPVWLTVAQAGQPWPPVPVDAASADDGSQDGAPADEGVAAGEDSGMGKGDGVGEEADATGDGASAALEAADADTTGAQAPDSAPGTGNAPPNGIVDGPGRGGQRQGDQAAGGAGGAAGSRGRRMAMRVLTVLVLLVGVALGMLLWRPADGTASDGDAGSTADRDSITRAELAALVERLQPRHRIRVERDDSGRLVLTGWVDSRADQEAVADAMTRVWPMPALRLKVADDVLRDVHDILADVPVYLRASITNDRLAVHGIADGVSTVQEASARIGALYPDLDIDVADVVPVADISTRVQAELDAAGVQNVQPAWEDGYLMLDVADLPGVQQAQVRQLAQRLNAQLWQRVRVAGPDAPQSLPFRIRSVVSGPQPYVVFPDGKRLTIGGIHHGLRLTAVNPDHIVFRDAAGDSVELSVPR